MYNHAVADGKCRLSRCISYYNWEISAKTSGKFISQYAELNIHAGNLEDLLLE